MNKKGFTLVELIAVVAILAILALLGIPKILDVINNTKIAAAKSNCEGYVKAFEDKLIDDQFDGPVPKDGVYYTKDINLDKNAKGEMPSDGWMYVVNGTVKKAEFKFGNYIVEYNGTNGNVSKTKTKVAPYNE